MSNRLEAFRRFLCGLPGYLREPVSYEAARATILRRLEKRNENFLKMVKRCVYQNPRSPYLPLLRDAQCEYSDMESSLARNELENLLARLLESGVRIPLEVYKGRKPLEHDGTRLFFREEDFDNPILSRGWESRTGGSTGPPSRMLIDLEFLADRAPYEHIMFRLLDLSTAPLALWYPKIPASIGLSNSLRYAKIGYPPACWFDMKLSGRSLPYWHSWSLAAVIGLCRLGAVPIPWPRAAPLDDPGVILDWISERIQRQGRCAVQSSVSGVVRLCRAAASRGVDLRGVQFITGSEPLTASKHAEIETTHARVFLRYHSTDLGSIASGCGAPADIDEVHLLSDTVALAVPDAEPAAEGTRRLCFTSILGRGPKVLLNVDLGDQAVIKRRGCGCFYEELGFHTHLSHVRSAGRSTVEGIALPYSELTRISEGILPRLIGGSILDYQWVEDEDPEAGSLTRLWLRLAPRLGTIDEENLIRKILAEIGKTDGAHRFYAQLLGDAAVLKILRENPRATMAGKTPAVVKGRSSGNPVEPAHLR
jgi:hypothetical protein